MTVNKNFLAVSVRKNSLSAWVLAVRPYSLGNSVILVCVASALAFSDGGFHWLPALLCLIFAVAMQCTANLVNDLWDFLKGAGPARPVGPRPRFCQRLHYDACHESRYRRIYDCRLPRRVRFVGVGLAFRHTPLRWLGIDCRRGRLCRFRLFYTAGPWPLAYHGLGDVAVVLFFGLVPVTFAYYLQTGTWSAASLLAALACGLVIDTMLMVNNFRDREEDARCDKRTMLSALGPVWGDGATLLWASGLSGSPCRCSFSDGRSPHCCRCPTSSHMSRRGAR